MENGCCGDFGGVDFSVIYLHLKVKIMFPSCKEAVVSSRLFISFPRLPSGSVCRWGGVCVRFDKCVCVFSETRPRPSLIGLPWNITVGQPIITPLQVALAQVSVWVACQLHVHVSVRFITCTWWHTDTAAGRRCSFWSRTNANSNALHKPE